MRLTSVILAMARNKTGARKIVAERYSRADGINPLFFFLHFEGLR